MTARITGLSASAGTALALLFTVASSNVAHGQRSRTPTFYKDVLPILQQNCQTCHRPASLAQDKAFITYDGVRPWARAIKQAVVTKKMPPWFADERYGHFKNAPTLSKGDIDTLVAWVDNGTPAGDATDAPAAVRWPDGWFIEPDAVVSMPEPYIVPAKGVVELTTFTLPSGFAKDTWITSIEVRPGVAAVVHHVVVSFQPHREDVKYGVPRATLKARDTAGVQTSRISRASDARAAQGSVIGLETVYVPGTPPLDFRLSNSAKLIPAGYDISVQMHYTPIGREIADRTQVGFTLAKEPPTRRFVTMSPTSPHDEERFHIPPHAANYESTTEVVFNHDAELVWFMPHMHLRGKDMTYTLTVPDGTSRIVLSVPRYDFEWQLGYDTAEPIHVAKGSRLRATAHYDNSANNKFNPDPNAHVWWGDQTWEEMMVPWFGVIVPTSINPREVVSYVSGVRD